MSRGPDQFRVVRTIGLELPEVEESTLYGKPALKVRGTLLACMASHKSAEPGSLVVRIGFDEREALIADDPRVYYLWWADRDRLADAQAHLASRSDRLGHGAD